MTLRLVASRRWRRTRRAGQKTRRSLKTQRLTAQAQAENRKELVSRCECSPILSRMTDEYAIKDIRARVRVWVWALDSRFLTLDSWFSILESHIPQTPTDKWPADRIETDVLLVLGRFLLRVRNCGPRGVFRRPCKWKSLQFVRATRPDLWLCCFLCRLCRARWGCLLWPNRRQAQ